MPKSKARKNVDENFKVAAVQRLQTGGVLANDLAKELGVSIWSLRKWSRQYRKTTAAGAGAAGEPAVPAAAPEELPAKRMFEKSSAGNRSSSRDANYHQYRQALPYRSDRCSLGADRADVTGSPTRWPTTHNQHSRCVKRNLLSSTNRLPMAFASPRVSSLEHRLSLLPTLEERWCLDLRPALNVPASSTASRSDRLSVGRHHGWPGGEDDGTWRHSRLRCAQAGQRPQAPHSGGHLRAAHRMQGRAG